MTELRVGWPVWIGVVVEDLEGQRAFYGDTLGMKEIAAGDGWAWFDMGWPNMFEIIKRSDTVPYERGPLPGGIHGR